MMASKSSLTLVHPPSYFDELGDFGKLTRQEKEITNYYKQYAWIQSGDSLLKKIGKVALGILTLTCSLWISSIIDETTKETRQTEFDSVVDKKEKRIINQIVNDFLRQRLTIDGASPVDSFYESLKEMEYSPAVRDEVQSLLESENFDEIQKIFFQREEGDTEGGITAISEKIKAKLKEETFPAFLETLKYEHGTLQALRILDTFQQGVFAPALNIIIDQEAFAGVIFAMPKRVPRPSFEITFDQSAKTITAQRRMDLVKPGEETMSVRITHTIALETLTATTKVEALS